MCFVLVNTATCHSRRLLSVDLTLNARLRLDHLTVNTQTLTTISLTVVNVLSM